MRSAFRSAWTQFCCPSFALGRMTIYFSVIIVICFALIIALVFFPQGVP